MILFEPSNHIKIIIVILLLLIAGGSITYNQFLISRLLKQERNSAELWAKAIEFNSRPELQEAGELMFRLQTAMAQNEHIPDSLYRMLLEIENKKTPFDFVTNELILVDRFNIPAIVLDEFNTVTFTKNIDPEDVTPKMIREFKSLGEPLTIKLGKGDAVFFQFVYVGQSPTVKFLKVVPFIQLALLSLMVGIGFTTYRSITRSEQSNLWVGMAKEAAHQLGTPISSLFGWVQLMQDEFGENESAKRILSEIGKDISRLERVAERFGKIGSAPELEYVNIRTVLENVMSYMKRRLPSYGKKIELSCDFETDAYVMLNAELFEWGIENIIKNAMDALKECNDNARITISTFLEGREVIIDIEDTGCGISLINLNKIFKPGFSTKKRGWGLGLSLSKRIIEEYHNGKVFVLRSELNEGTTFRIILKDAGGKS